MAVRAPPDAATADPWLQVDGLHVRRGGQPVLVDTTLHLARGELGCLLGASGCGKSTLLRAIAGLQAVDAGRIALDGVAMSVPGRMLAAERRRVGLVFQDLALFPHLDVAANIAFGLHRLDRAQRQRRVDELVERLRLKGLDRRYPHELSGGQQQRVAIARALAPEPVLLLLDEPFSSLDAGLRQQLRGELRALLQQLGLTALLVTHDQEEALGFADRVAVMQGGRIAQVGTPWQLYHQPASRYVAGFVGEGVLLPLQAAAGGWRCALGAVALAQAPAPDSALLVRPDDLAPDPASTLRAVVAGVEFRGAEQLLTLRLGGGERVLALWPSHEVARAGESVGLHWQPPHQVVLAPDP